MEMIITEVTFWEYDPGTNKWTKKANVGGGARAYAVGFSVGGKGYIGMGEFSGQMDLWQYSPDATVADAQMVSSDASACTTWAYYAIQIHLVVVYRFNTIPTFRKQCSSQYAIFKEE